MLPVRAGILHPLLHLLLQPLVKHEFDMRKLIHKFIHLN